MLSKPSLPSCLPQCCGLVTPVFSPIREGGRGKKTLYHYSCFTNIIKYIYNYSAVLWGHSNTKYLTTV